MLQLASKQGVLDVMHRYGFTFRKRYGQNFLIDEEAVKTILDAADLDKQTGVIEIGPGFGTMTGYLAQKAGAVTAIELDDALIPILQDLLGGFQNVRILHADALKVDLNAVIREMNLPKVSVVANLPYYITTPILMALLTSGVSFDKITVMVQREVAQRMAAAPGNRERGAISVAVQYYTKPTICGIVPADKFFPVPQVDSAVLCLTRRETPPVTVEEKRFFAVVKAAFSQRRKMLTNTLTASGLFSCSKEELATRLQEVGISGTARAETLTMEEFARIADLCDL